MAELQLTTDTAGRAVVRKWGGAGPVADRLRHEALVLRAAAHPGVASVVGEHEAATGGFELLLAVAGSRTLADLRTDLAGVAGVVAALAATVADLHDLGIVHGRITADHVVIDGAGRPVLCGFAEAGPPAEGRRPADDVHAIGTLLGSLAAPPGGADALADWEPIPERRWRSAERWQGFLRRALLTVADQATADDPTHRPPARALASAVLSALPDARLPTDRRPTERRPGVRQLGRRRPPARRRREPEVVEPAAVAPPTDAIGLLDAASGRVPAAPPRRPAGPTSRSVLTPVAAAVGLGLLVFGVGALLRPPAPAVFEAAGAPGPSTTSEAAASTTAARPTTTARSATTAPTVAPTPAAPVTVGVPSCPPAAAPVADPDGDGCGSTALVGDGVVEVDGVRYGVGAAGDLLAVGDWDCDGVATVALVHRGSGEVFVFDRWATGTTTATATSTGTVAGAAALESPDPDGDGCPTLVVVDEAGARTAVPA